MQPNIGKIGPLTRTLVGLVQMDDTFTLKRIRVVRVIRNKCGICTENVVEMPWAMFLLRMTFRFRFDLCGEPICLLKMPSIHTKPLLQNPPCHYPFHIQAQCSYTYIYRPSIISRNTYALYYCSDQAPLVLGLRCVQIFRFSPQIIVFWFEATATGNIYCPITVVLPSNLFVA